MKVYSEFRREKLNLPVIRGGVLFLECPLIGERTVLLFTPTFQEIWKD